MSHNETSKLKFVFYDTETTGVNVEFDQIIQVLAILTDEDFSEIDRINIRCRRMPWIVPSLGAMLITGVGPIQIDDPVSPQFPEMMAVIRETIESWSPAIFIGYNSFYFDEPLLQRALWQCLKYPYMTVTGGNSRGDLLPLIRAVAKLAPHAISIPNVASGRPSFKLGRIAPLNGFSHKNAHDALVDAQAVLHLSKKIASRAPKLWKAFLHGSLKTTAEELLRSKNPIYFVEPLASGRHGWWGLSIGSGTSSRSNSLVVKLEADWVRLFSENDPIQDVLIREPAYQYRWVKSNMLPIAFTASEALESFGITPSNKEQRSAKFLASADRRSRLLSLAARISTKRPEPVALEQKIFEGFPGENDGRVMREFWSLPWPQRFPLIRKFDDHRFQQLAQRLIFLMAPESLSDADRARVTEGIRDRLLAEHSDKSLWRTIQLAQIEVEELRKSHLDIGKLDEIASWLSNIEAYLVDA